MTMAQGGLFGGNEEASGLFATDLHGQSQTRKAKYHRAYRSDPKNKDRINSQKKRRRALKKESELGSVSSMFSESVAAPAKNEPQTVEKVLNRSDKASLPNLGGEANGELSNSSRNYCQKEQMAALNGSKKESIEVESSSLQIQNQSELLTDLRDSFRRIHDELKALRDEVKPATLPLPVDKLEQQVANESVKNVNPGNLTKTVDGEKNKTIAKLLIEKLPTFGMSLLILTFLAFNTFFLVSEQKSLYESMSYSAGMAMMIAVLSEASLILLSAMASWTSNLEWKIGLTTGMVLMVAVMVGILDSSAASRVNTAARQSQEAKNIADEIDALKKLREPILSRIENLDPQHYRTEISRLSSQLTTSPEGYSYKIEQLSSQLATISTAHADISKMVWQRRVSLLLNLLFSSFLGFLWARDQEGVLTKIGKTLNGVLNSPCVT